jgi:metal-responsive CopG/Arc/MetJ family transcriptional regulator
MRDIEEAIRDCIVAVIECKKSVEHLTQEVAGTLAMARQRLESAQAGVAKLEAVAQAAREVLKEALHELRYHKGRFCLEIWTVPHEQMHKLADALSALRKLEEESGGD